MTHPAPRPTRSPGSTTACLWVTIPGHGEAKLGAATARGGVPLTVATELRALPPSAVHHETLPTAGSATVGDQSVVLVDEAGPEAWRRHVVERG